MESRAGRISNHASARVNKTRRVDHAASATVADEKQSEDGMTEPTEPRPTARDDDASKSRHRRMFAGLLGTLKQSKTKNDNEKDVMAKRKSIEEAVVGKNEEISRELREAQFKAFVEKRDVDEKIKFDLDMKYKETEKAFIEVQYEEWKNLISAGGILTTTEPMLVYTLNTHTPETQAKAQTSAARLEHWKTHQLERIENAINTIIRRREETAARREKARTQGEENGEDVDVELEDHEELTLEGLEDEDTTMIGGEE